jgi:hypothetical protein
MTHRIVPRIGDIVFISERKLLTGMNPLNLCSETLLTVVSRALSDLGVNEVDLPPECESFSGL